MIAGVLAASVPQIACAQDDPGTSTPAPATNAVCMTGPAALGSSGGSITVVVTSGPAQTLAAQGFQPAACSSQPGAFASYQTQICKLAGILQADVQDQFTRTYNVSPGDLCSWAGAVTGLP